MIKDVIIEALKMLNLSSEAEKVLAGEEEVTAELLRIYNLVVSELHDVYRRDDYATPPIAMSVNEAEADFYGVSPRVMAYGVCAEYCITQGLDEAELWDGRYKDALSLIKRKSRRIPGRRFY
ncbi:MAG: hypothetical protein IKM44_01485 [Clostridia bacterium]|nr:hypothetical protein [Clostridia bacterium]